MLLMARRLKRRFPHDRILAFGYPTRSGGIANHAQRLQWFIEHEVPKGANLHFVCHSLGSLVVRATAGGLQEAYSLGRAVLLGPPNQGAITARALGRFALPRKIFGPTLNEIGALTAPPATDLLDIGILAGCTGIPIGFTPLLPGDNDGLVLLKETYLPGAIEHKRVFMHHTIMPFSARMARLAANFIETGRF